MADPVAAFAAAWARRPPGPVLIAVSGGSDSMALLRLALAAGGEIRAATVDHGLRAASAAEAAQVAAWCAGLGVPHRILRWQGWDGRGNKAQAARDARRALLAGAATDCGCIAYGHTLDDQAETVLLRLMRGSGVDGLAAMAERGEAGGAVLFRPLLEIPRAALREYLRGLGQGWIEDPSNDDPTSDRVRARALLAGLDIPARRLAATARLMRAARETLEAQCDRDAAALVRWFPQGYVEADRALADLPLERRLRLAARVLGAVAGAPLRPRLGALEAALADWGGAGRSLHGCLLQPCAAGVRVLREPAALAPWVMMDGAPVLWDGRWWVAGPPGAVGALGAAVPEALAALPAAVRQGLPAIRHGGALVGVPHAGIGPWTARPGPLWPKGTVA